LAASFSILEGNLLGKVAIAFFFQNFLTSPAIALIDFFSASAIA
jgi:hypothetical protein